MLQLLITKDHKNAKGRLTATKFQYKNFKNWLHISIHHQIDFLNRDLMPKCEIEVNTFESSESCTLDGEGMSEIIYSRKNTLVTGVELSDSIHQAI